MEYMKSLEYSLKKREGKQSIQSGSNLNHIEIRVRDIDKIISSVEGYLNNDEFIQRTTFEEDISLRFVDLNVKFPKFESDFILKNNEYIIYQPLNKIIDMSTFFPLHLLEKGVSLIIKNIVDVKNGYLVVQSVCKGLKESPIFVSLIYCDPESGDVAHSIINSETLEDREDSVSPFRYFLDEKLILQDTEADGEFVNQIVHSFCNGYLFIDITSLEIVTEDTDAFALFFKGEYKGRLFHESGEMFGMIQNMNENIQKRNSRSHCHYNIEEDEIRNLHLFHDFLFLGKMLFHRGDLIESCWFGIEDELPAEKHENFLLGKDAGPSVYGNLNPLIIFSHQKEKIAASRIILSFVFPFVMMYNIGDLVNLSISIENLKKRNYILPNNNFFEFSDAFQYLTCLLLFGVKQPNKKKFGRILKTKSIVFQILQYANDFDVYLSTYPILHHTYYTFSTLEKMRGNSFTHKKIPGNTVSSFFDNLQRGWKDLNIPVIFRYSTVLCYINELEKYKQMKHSHCLDIFNMYNSIPRKRLQSTSSSERRLLLYSESNFRNLLSHAFISQSKMNIANLSWMKKYILEVLIVLRKEKEEEMFFKRMVVVERMVKDMRDIANQNKLIFKYEEFNGSVEEVRTLKMSTRKNVNTFVQRLVIPMSIRYLYGFLSSYDVMFPKKRKKNIEEILLNFAQKKIKEKIGENDGKKCTSEKAQQDFEDWFFFEVYMLNKKMKRLTKCDFTTGTYFDEEEDNGRIKNNKYHFNVYEKNKKDRRVAVKLQKFSNEMMVFFLEKMELHLENEIERFVEEMYDYEFSPKNLRRSEEREITMEFVKRIVKKWDFLNEEDIFEKIMKLRKSKYFTCRKCGWTTKKCKICSGCFSVYYCGPGCQKKDWKKTHRNECK